MLFSNPKNIFEDKFNEIFLKEDKDEFEMFLSIVSLLVYQNIRNEDLIRIYREVGIENFVRIMDIFNGRTIKMPKIEEIKDLFIVAVCYYYKEIQGLDWKDIKEQLPFDISSISYGSKIKNLNRYVVDQMKTVIEDFYSGKEEG